MLVEAQAAQDAIAALQVEPRGVVKLTCPVTLLHVHIGPMLARFMARYPDVSVQLEATNRRVDVIGEGLDVAIRVRPRPFEDSDTVMRVLADRGHRLYASPRLIEQMGAVNSPAELTRWPGLSLASGKHVHRWELFGPQGARAEVHFTPRMITTDMLALREASIAGVGGCTTSATDGERAISGGRTGGIARRLGAQAGNYSRSLSVSSGIAALGTRHGGFLNRRICADD